MLAIINYLKLHYSNEKGQGIVEYALILAAVVVLAGFLGSKGTLGLAVQETFNNVIDALK